MTAVLIVDDEDDVRDSLRDFFEDEGYSVSTAADGTEALTVLEGQVPCVVILDLIMPVMSGGDVYTKMQTDPRLAKVPVIVCTSDPSRAPVGVPIVRKPVDLARLLAAVRRVCHRKSSRRWS